MGSKSPLSDWEHFDRGLQRVTSFGAAQELIDDHRHKVRTGAFAKRLSAFLQTRRIPENANAAEREAVAKMMLRIGEARPGVSSD